MTNTAQCVASEISGDLLLEHLTSRSITISAYRVWHQLKDLANRAADKIARLSYQDLASLLGISAKTVMRAVKQLCRLELLEKQMQKVRGCYYDANSYALPQALQEELPIAKEVVCIDTPVPDVAHEQDSCHEIRADKPASSAVEAINKKIQRFKEIHEKADSEYKLAQQKIIDEPGVLMHLNALGTAETLRNQALQEISYLEEDLIKMGEQVKANSHQASLQQALLNPKFFHEARGDRILTDSQYDQFVRVLANFDQSSPQAINGLVYMVRFGSLVTNKQGHTNTIDRAMGIAMKLVRERRYIPMTDSYLIEKIEKYLR